MVSLSGLHAYIIVCWLSKLHRPASSLPYFPFFIFPIPVLFSETFTLNVSTVSGERCSAAYSSLWEIHRRVTKRHLPKVKLFTWSLARDFGRRRFWEVLEKNEFGNKLGKSLDAKFTNFSPPSKSRKVPFLLFDGAFAPKLVDAPAMDVVN